MSVSVNCSHQGNAVWNPGHYTRVDAILRDFALDKIIRILVLGYSVLNHQPSVMDDACTKDR